MLKKTLKNLIKTQEQYIDALKLEHCPDFDCEKCLMKSICTHQGIKRIDCPQRKISCTECGFYEKGKCRQKEIYKAQKKLNKLKLQANSIHNNSFAINLQAFDSIYSVNMRDLNRKTTELEINEDGIVLLNGKQLFEIGGL